MTRLSTAGFYRSSLGGLLNRQADSGRLQVQLAAGKRIQRGADDPSGVARATQLRQRLNEVKTDQDNILVARNSLQQQADLYGDIDRVLNQAREAAVAAANGSRSDADLRSFAGEIRGNIDELLRLANSQDDQGNYVFSGLAGNTPAFALGADQMVSYQGDRGQRELSIGGGEHVVVTASGYSVFQSVPDGNGDFVVEPAASNQGSGVIQSGSVRDPATWAVASGNYQIEAGLRLPATEGLVAFTDQGSDDALSYSYSINGVTIETLSEGDSRDSVQLAAAINAQTASTGVSAALHDGALYLGTTAPGGAIELVETLAGGSAAGDSVEGIFGSNLHAVASGAVATQRVVPLSTQADSWWVNDGNGATIASGEYADGVTLQFEGIETRLNGQPATGDRFDLQPASEQDLFTTLGKLATGLEQLGYEGGEGTRLRNLLNRSIAEIDQGLQHTAQHITRSGGYLQRLDAAEAANTAQDTRLQTLLSSIEDLDFTQAATELSQQLVALQAAQQSFLRIQGLNLFDLL